MECREPLVTIVPRPPVADNQNMGWSSRSNARHRANPPTPPQPPMKKRLPLPKNVVLMSLIEATELAAENARTTQVEPSLTNSPLVKLSSSILDVEQDEQEKIKTGTSLAISDCGTYAVAAKGGLEIVPTHPESGFQLANEPSDEDVDNLVRVFHLDKIENTEKSTDGEASIAPAKLVWGDRVQIVSIENGWAKLARGYGFVRAGGHQLVKGKCYPRLVLLCNFLVVNHPYQLLLDTHAVGGSVDRSCKLEALLRLLSTRRKELRDDQMRADNQFIGLFQDLQASLTADEDLTVITAATFKDKDKDFEEDEKQNNSVAHAEKRDNESSGHPLGQDVRSATSNEDSTPLKPRPMERPATPPAGSTAGNFLCGSLDSMIPLGTSLTGPPALPASTPRRHTRADDLSHTQTTGSNSFDSTPNRLLSTSSNPSPGALMAGARAWREMHGRQASTAIDFRTGMSGHSALTSSSSHAHDILAQGINRYSMSNHTGLTMYKPTRTPSRPMNTLAMPSSGASGSDDGSTMQSSPTSVDHAR